MCWMVGVSGVLKGESIGMLPSANNSEKSSSAIIRNMEPSLRAAESVPEVALGSWKALSLFWVYKFFTKQKKKKKKPQTPSC